MSDHAQVDRAFCNRAGVEIEQGFGPRYTEELRAVLQRNGSAWTNCLAAYYLSRILELTGESGKANFYARLAFQFSGESGDTVQRAAARNLLAGRLAAQNDLVGAVQLFEEARALMPSELRIWRALTESNLGYCLVLQGRSQAGLALLYKGLGGMDAAQEHAFGLSCHLFLSFAQLRTRRYRRAAQHGLAALAIAELHQSSEGAKSALWLLGEAAKCSGSVGLARAYFSRLQRDFYPRGHQLVEGLLDVDLPPLVNLMA